MVLNKIFALLNCSGLRVILFPLFLNLAGLFDVSLHVLNVAKLTVSRSPVDVCVQFSVHCYFSFPEAFLTLQYLKFKSLKQERSGMNICFQVHLSFHSLTVIV